MEQTTKKYLIVYGVLVENLDNVTTSSSGNTATITVAKGPNDKFLETRPLRVDVSKIDFTDISVDSACEALRLAMTDNLRVEAAVELLKMNMQREIRSTLSATE